MVEQSASFDCRLFPDGCYFADMFGVKNEIYVEKSDGVFFLADGTGWRHPLEHPESIVALRPARLETPPVVDYGPRSYPLSQFFES